jgi:hypothetical protein
MSDVGRKEVDILRLGLEVILLESFVPHNQIRANCFPHKNSCQECKQLKHF